MAVLPPVDNPLEAFEDPSFWRDAPDEEVEDAEAEVPVDDASLVAAEVGFETDVTTTVTGACVVCPSLV